MSDPIDLDYVASRAAAYIERNPDGGSGLWLADDVLRLIAEVRRLRALPVLRACSDCGHMGSLGGEHFCELIHAEREDFDPRVYTLQPVPSWCPLRRSP